MECCFHGRPFASPTRGVLGHRGVIVTTSYLETYKLVAIAEDRGTGIMRKTGSDKVVLGIPWLKEYNPNIDWQTEKITLVEETGRLVTRDH